MNRRIFLTLAVSTVFSLGRFPWVWAKSVEPDTSNRFRIQDVSLKDYLHKMRNFDVPHMEDIYVEPEDCHFLESVVFRFRKIIKMVGHGNFALLSLDEAIQTARDYQDVGCFSENELIFLEKIFYTESSVYGFLDDKPLKNLTDRIDKQRTVKIPYSGNYLYQGHPFETYQQIKNSIGENVILTSGLRSIVKQFYLFLNKVYTNQGNLSLASRSLAPPGYSFHGIGDFDVGQVNFGEFNFTEKFTDSGVYKKLTDLGYSGFRYPDGNQLGVRFEPWHIKVS
ncbi:MAG: M15 family metallopeptidase [Pseudomonadota bacterium]